MPAEGGAETFSAAAFAKPPDRVRICHTRIHDQFMLLKRRRLPHLDIPGEPVFVTFRLHGSLPAHRPFEPSMLESGRAFVAMDRLLDQARSGPTFLREPEIAQIVRTSLRKGVELSHYALHSWVIMPNHVQFLITPEISLSRLLQSMKLATAKRANQLLGRTGSHFWQSESFDRQVRNREEFRRIQRYIEGNPVAAGLARRVEEYRWSSAWAGNKEEGIS
jgi:REP element-mobilizing transposase RayT